MGVGPSVGRNNDELITCLVDNNYIRFRSVEWAMRLVDRGAYFPADHREDAYKDLAFKSTIGEPGCIHLSAPCIYANALEFLNLKPGMSFLNVGSGTGYFNTCAGYLLGESGTNHGVEIYENLVQYARDHLAVALRTAESTAFSFCTPEFFVGSAFYLRPTMRYDRIYCGAMAPHNRRAYFGYMLKVGGIMVLPYGSRLIRIVRESENQFVVHRISTVTFSELLHPNPSIERTTQECILPALNPRSLAEYCRTAIRGHIRRVTLNGRPMPTLFEIQPEERGKTSEEVGTQSDPIETETEEGEQPAAVDRPPLPVNVTMHIVVQEQPDGAEQEQEVEHPPQEDGIDVRRPPDEEEAAGQRGDRMAELFEDVEALMFEAAANEERARRNEEGEGREAGRVDLLVEDGLDAELRRGIGPHGDGQAAHRGEGGGLPFDDDNDDDDQNGHNNHDQGGGGIAAAEAVDEEEVNPAGAAAVMAGAEPNDPNARPDGRMFELPAAEEEVRGRRHRIAQMLRRMRQERALRRAQGEEEEEQEEEDNPPPEHHMMIVMERNRHRVEIRHRGPLRIIRPPLPGEEEEMGGDLQMVEPPPALGLAPHDSTTPAVFTTSLVAPQMDEVDLSALILGYATPRPRRSPAIRQEQSTARPLLRPQPLPIAQRREEGGRGDEMNIVDAAQFAACLFSMRQRVNAAQAREGTEESEEEQRADRPPARHSSGSNRQSSSQTTTAEQEGPQPGSSGIGIAIRNGMKRTMPASTDATGNKQAKRTTQRPPAEPLNLSAPILSHFDRRDEQRTVAGQEESISPNSASSTLSATSSASSTTTSTSNATSMTTTATSSASSRASSGLQAVRRVPPATSARRRHGGYLDRSTGTSDAGEETSDSMEVSPEDRRAEERNDRSIAYHQQLAAFHEEFERRLGKLPLSARLIRFLRFQLE